MMEKLEEFFLPLAEKLAANKYLTVIREGFVAILPIMIVGSFFVLINNVIIGPDGYFNKLFGLEVKPLLGYGNSIIPATLSIVAILLTFTTAKKLSVLEDVDDTIVPVIAVVNFAVLTPFVFNDKMGIEYVNTMFTGSAALFLAFGVAILSTLVIKFLSNIEKLKIKMPEGVPEGVSKSFNLLIPIILTIFVFATARVLVDLSGESITSLIFSIIQSPFTYIVNSSFGLTAIYTLYMLLWGLGIHSAFIFGPILEPIYLTSLNANFANFQEGAALTNIITKPFIDSVAFMGGAGNMLALIAAIFISSRREDYRKIAKIGLAPAIFNISETIMFGLPVVMNPILIIPMILSTLFGILIGSLSTVAGIMGYSYILVPWTTPPIANAFLSTGGSIGAVLTVIVIFIGSVVIYTPFVIIMNKQANKQLN